MRIRILLLIKESGLQTLQGSILSLQGLHCELLNFVLNADPRTALHSNADTDPDPASKNNADPDPQLSTCRPKQPCFGPGSGLGLDPDHIQTGENVP